MDRQHSRTASGRLREPCAPAATGKKESDMVAPTAFCARIENRRGDALGALMSSMRVWLDRRRIDVVGFASVPRTRGIAAFDCISEAKKMSSYSDTNSEDGTFLGRRRRTA